MSKFSFRAEKETKLSFSKDEKEDLLEENHCYFERVIKQWTFPGEETPIEDRVFIAQEKYVLLMKYEQNGARWCFNIPFLQNRSTFAKQLDDAMLELQRMEKVCR